MVLEQMEFMHLTGFRDDFERWNLDNPGPANRESMEPNWEIYDTGFRCVVEYEP